MMQLIGIAEMQNLAWSRFLVEQGGEVGTLTLLIWVTRHRGPRRSTGGSMVCCVHRQ